jgi:hypothetical protein
MAAPSYTTDLTTFNDCTSTTGWVEMTNMANGGGADLDTDLGIVSDRCISELIRKTGLASLAYNNGATVTVGTNGGFFVWSKYQAPNSIGTRTNGGIGVVIGSAAGTWGNFNMDGSDTYPYGGWTNYFVDPTLTPDAENGTYSTTAFQYCGTSINVLAAVSKGNPQSIDFMRYGRGESRFTDGDLGNGYATFDGFALVNDVAATARWGLFSDQGGSYLWKGLMSLGLTATSVDMRDSNVTITIDDTIKADPSFNRIEVHNASSNVNWTSVLITKVGTVSLGEFECIDNATVLLTGCVFTDMSTFIFQSNTTTDGTTFRRCNLVTNGGAAITDSLFEESVSTVSIITSTPNKITGTKFVSDGSNHAIEIDTPGSYTFTGNIFENHFTGSSPTADVNAVIYNNSGGAVTLNAADITGVISYRNGAGASTTVNNNVAVTVTGLKENTEVRVLAFGTNTELAGIENATAGITGSREFTFSLGAAVETTVVIHNLQYEYIALDYTIPGTAADLPIQQQFDRNYLNP